MDVQWLCPIVRKIAYVIVRGSRVFQHDEQAVASTLTTVFVERNWSGERIPNAVALILQPNIEPAN